MKKFEVSEEFLKAAHNAACDGWKRRIEKEIPEAFKSGLEVGKWYNNRTGALFCVTAINLNERGMCAGYGFSKKRRWDSGDGSLIEWVTSLLTPATTEEVQEALINEAKKQGFKEGVKVRETGVGNGNLDTISTRGFKFYPDENQLFLGGCCIFEDGQWATIIEEPIKKVTQADIEALYGCKVEIV